MTKHVTTDKALTDRVARVLEMIRPALQQDGGDIKLLNVSTCGQVQLQFLGACIGCPSNSMTLTMGIERNLKQQIPEVTSVVCS